MGKTVSFPEKIDKHSLKRIKKIHARKMKEELHIKKHALPIERIKTGIQGFDALVEGGIPKNSLMLVTGGPGTGKTTFGVEYLVQGALKGERGVYVSLEEDSEKIENTLEQFGWPVKNLEKENKLFILKPNLVDFSKLKELVEDTVTNFGAKRLVIDSISLLKLYFRSSYTVRKTLLDLEKKLKEMDCTTIMVSETPKEMDSLSPFGVEEFIADGIVLLNMVETKGEFKRSLAIRKMRLTNHSLKIHPIKIKKQGGIEIGAKKAL